MFRNEKKQIALWSTLAEDFEEGKLKSMTELVIIAVVSLMVKQYLGIFVFILITKILYKYYKSIVSTKI